ncbi:YihY/virulence factor BrkB family protein [Pseudoclavibacter caeni]|jgi:membrane protein|uniref:YihY/virulence factor BrkB family protein n=1 Tax=Pseudoclavibacter caeni TaxID=908846 RepID=A0A7C8BNB5_9MICO|nr:YihY/virulence factor BrkB family protein [Pseudoclavibacter caeni]KAB1631945.1 YihY/virulence factor BrkB family protein [Pseudoclavibacter caeni]NYJ96856.1 membrane protein [Pseudoclavibacter caeni]
MSERPRPLPLLRALVGWAMQTRPARALTLYRGKGGPVLAAGMSYSALFAAFAGLWTLFSVVGLLLARDRTVWDALVAYIAESVPGLVDTGAGGAITPEALDGVPGTLSWTGAIALVSLLVTLFGWLDAARTGVRALFGRDPLPAQPLLGHLRDLAVLVGFGVVVVLSALLSAANSRLGTLVAAWLGLDDRGPVADLLVRAGSVLLSVALDALVLVIIFRVLARITVPVRRMLPTVLGGAVATTALKLAGGLLVGRTGNPLLASFVTIVGLLVWFNLLSQVTLVTAAWLAVSISDHEDPRDLDLWGHARLPQVLRDPATPPRALPVQVPDSAIETAPPDPASRTAAPEVAPADASASGPADASADDAVHPTSPGTADVVTPPAEETAAPAAQSSSRRGRDDTAR